MEGVGGVVEVSRGQNVSGGESSVAAVLQVGLVGALLSSCSAAGRWRVRDLAGLGRDDLFSGLRYVRSCVPKKGRRQAGRPCLFAADRSAPPALPSPPFCLAEGGDGNMRMRGGPQRAPPPHR